MLLADLIHAYEQIVPLDLSLPSDRNGLKTGTLEQDVQNVLGCLELTPEVATYAIEQDVDCVFVHHDPFYVPLRDLRADNVHAQTILQLVAHNIALYVSHTNLDVVQHGLNDYLFTLLGAQAADVLDPLTGIGRFGTLPQAMSLASYIETFVRPIQSQFRVSTHDMNKSIEHIAVVSGAGASYLTLAREVPVDLFITGDIDYHTAMLAREYDLPVIDLGHDAEHVVSTVFAQIFERIQAESGEHLTIIDAESFNFCPWENL